MEVIKNERKNDMKRTIALLAALSLFAVACTNNSQKGENKTSAMETSNNYDRAQVLSDAEKFFNKDGGLLLAAGDKDKSNAMTIAWGAVGTLWQKPAMTVYVAEGRYTYEFMEKSGYFTVMQFKDRDVLKYMGTNSGRDGDKAAHLGLHTLYTKNGTPYYQEADLVVECRLMYKAPFDPASFTDEVPKNFYDGFKAGVHHMYIGEIVDTIKK